VKEKDGWHGKVGNRVGYGNYYTNPSRGSSFEKTYAANQKREKSRFFGILKQESHAVTRKPCNAMCYVYLYGIPTGISGWSMQSESPSANTHCSNRIRPNLIAQFDVTAVMTAASSAEILPWFYTSQRVGLWLSIVLGSRQHATRVTAMVGFRQTKCTNQITTRWQHVQLTTTAQLPYTDQCTASSIVLSHTQGTQLYYNVLMECTHVSWNWQSYTFPTWLADKRLKSIGLQIKKITTRFLEQMRFRSN